MTQWNRHVEAVHSVSSLHLAGATHFRNVTSQVTTHQQLDLVTSPLVGMFPLRMMLPRRQGHALCTLAPALCYPWGGMCRQRCKKDSPRPPLAGAERVCVSICVCLCKSRCLCVYASSSMCVCEQNVIANAHNKKGKENANIWSIDSCFNLWASSQAAEEHFLCRTRFSFPLHTIVFPARVFLLVLLSGTTGRHIRRFCFSTCSPHCM